MVSVKPRGAETRRLRAQSGHLHSEGLLLFLGIPSKPLSHQVGGHCAKGKRRVPEDKYYGFHFWEVPEMIKFTEGEIRGLSPTQLVSLPDAQAPKHYLWAKGILLHCSSIGLGLLLCSFSKVMSTAAAESTASSKGEAAWAGSEPGSH